MITLLIFLTSLSFIMLSVFVYLAICVVCGADNDVLRKDYYR